MSILPRYETVGDVRQEVDTLLASSNLHIGGGTFYPYTQALIFGVLNDDNGRVGDVYCPLPNGGWASETYIPASQDADDGIHFRVIKGAGKLILPFEATCDIDSHFPGIAASVTSNNRLGFQLINPNAELLVIHASSLADPANHTDVNRPGAQQIDDAWTLASGEVFTHAQTFRSEGGVIFDLC